MKERKIPFLDIDVLCLEDRDEDAELMHEMLIAEGYNPQFVLVKTEKEFIDKLKSKTFNLILSDFNLPGFDGFTALKYAKKICPEVPFICVSGTIGEDLAVDLLKQGASYYVLKQKLEKLPIAVQRSLCEVKEKRALHEAEKELRKLSQAVHQSPVSTLITDINGIIEYVNPKTLLLTGYTKGELIGKNPRIFSSGKNTNDMYKELWHTIGSGRVWQGELLNKKKDGTLYWEAISISPIFDEAGKVLHYLAVKEDITERKKLTLDLIEAKERAEESDRLKTAFLTNISHEIRTPMNGILGFAELLKSPYLTGKKQREFIRIIEKSGERMLNIINDIVEISKIESGQTILHMEQTNVNQIIRDLHAFFKHDKKGIDLTYITGLADDDSIIETDSTKLNQILTNLIKNAFKFTESGSVKFGYIIKNNMLEFHVDDTGIGIAPEQKKLIFERFRQVDMSHTRKYEGAGLGLSISKAYVKMLGGCIWVESEVGKGTSFFFSIPYNPVNNASHQMPDSTETLSIPEPVNILIADDEYNIRLYFNEMFENEQIKLYFAENGEIALEKIKSIPQIDIVFMDLKMPVMNGLEAIRQIKMIRPDIPVIAQTAYASSDDERIARLTGCDEFITKPFSRQILFSTINKLLPTKKNNNLFA